MHAIEDLLQDGTTVYEGISLIEHFDEPTPDEWELLSDEDEPAIRPPAALPAEDETGRPREHTSRSPSPEGEVADYGDDVADMVEETASSVSTPDFQF